MADQVKPGRDAKPEPPGGGTGMGKLDMKKLLVRAKQARVNCAVAQGESDDGLVLLDRVKPPKAVLKDLRKQFPKARTPCWGTASVDADTDPKLVTFSINRKVAGLSKRLIKTLRGTGFTKVAIRTGEADEPG